MSDTTCIDDLPANKLINLYLMASFLYYIKDISPIEDGQYDTICKQLILKYQDIDHQHGHLITKDALHAGTAFHLREIDYPLLVQSAAFAWYDKDSPVTCGFKSRRRRTPTSVVEDKPEVTKPTRRRRRR